MTTGKRIRKSMPKMLAKRSVNLSQRARHPVLRFCCFRYAFFGWYFRLRFFRSAYFLFVWCLIELLSPLLPSLYNDKKWANTNKYQIEGLKNFIYSGFPLTIRAGGIIFPSDGPVSGVYSFVGLAIIGNIIVFMKIEIHIAEAVLCGEVC